MKTRQPILSAGFSLIEMMICVTMLAVTFIAALGFVTGAWRATNTNEDKVQAVQKAISILSEIRSFLETPIIEEDEEGELTSRSKTVLDLDALDDGSGTQPLLTISDKCDDPEKVPSCNQYMTRGRLSGAGSRGYVTSSANMRAVLDDNGNQTGETRWWRFERQVQVTPVYEQGILVSRDVRLVVVRVYSYRQDGTRTLLADVGTILRTTAESYPTTQVYDVYCLAMDTIPGWWVYMSYIKPFVENCLKDLENRNPGLDIREHWITKTGYGRDPEYAPYFNNTAPTTTAVDYVYWYPGLLAACDVDKYYSPERVKARVNVDNVLANDYDSAENAFPYAVADQWNHCLRYTEAMEYYNKRGGAEGEGELPYHLLLDDMILNPGKYLNAVMINLHGELLPVPPVRNYADPAKDPVNHPGWRVVTHPEKIWYDNTDPGDTDGDGTDEWKEVDNPDAYVNLRVYAYVEPRSGAPYPLANDANGTNPNKQGYYTTSTTGHPCTLHPVANTEYMKGDDANASGGANANNTNVPIRVAIEFEKTDGTFEALDLIHTSSFPNGCPKPRVWKVEGGFDLTTQPNAGNPDLPPTAGPDGVQDDYWVAECPLYNDMTSGPTGDPLQTSAPVYAGEMYCRFAPPSDEVGETIHYSVGGGLRKHRNQFGEPKETTVLELFNTPLYTPQVSMMNGGPNTFTGLINRRSSVGSRYHLYQLEYIPCSTDFSGWDWLNTTAVCSSHFRYNAATNQVERKTEVAPTAANPSYGFPPSLKNLDNACRYGRNLAWGGYPDVVVARGHYSSSTNSQTNRLSLHATSTWATGDVHADAHDSRAIAVADMDNDGDMDIVVGNYQNTAKWLYSNDGLGVFTSTTIGATRYLNDIALADLNRDGVLDIVEAQGGASNDTQLRQNFVTYGSAGTSWTVSSSVGLPEPATNRDTYAVATGDVNGDGWVDIVAGNGCSVSAASSQTNLEEVVYLNNGAGGFAASGANVIGTGGDITRDVALGDLDGDGDLDLVVGNWGTANLPAKSKIYYNDGTGLFTSAAVLLPTEAGVSYYQTTSVAVGDVNHDDLPDIVMGIWGSYPTKVYINEGGGSFTLAPVSVEAGTYQTSDVTLADINNDGWLDIVTVAYGGTARYYLNQRSTAAAASGTTGTWFGAAQTINGTNENSTAVAVGQFAMRPKNTARWIIQVPKLLLKEKSGALRVTTRIGKDLTTGVFWPLAPDAGNDITGRNDPANVSRTCTWWVDKSSKVPFSERYQFIGDARHCPYADLRNNGTTPPATTPFADGYNWYFCDFREGTGSNDARTHWGDGFDANRMTNASGVDGWDSTNRVEFDVPRYFYWLRSALIESRSIFTTLTGWSFYYMCMGNEVGYDAANGTTFSNGVPINNKIMNGSGTGTTYQAQMHLSDYPHSAKLIAVDPSVAQVDGGRWWNKPWLGELYPDALYATNWRWPEDGEAAFTPPPTQRGNLPTGTGANTFRWVRRRDTCYSGSSYADYGRPYGNEFLYSMRRTMSYGCTSMFNSEASVGGNAFCHTGLDGQTGTLQTVGLQLANRYYFPVPTTTKISRPFKFDQTSTKPNEWSFYPYSSRNTTKIPNEMTDSGGNPSTQIFYNHQSAGYTGSAIVRVTAPAVDADGDGTTDNLQKCAYIVVNGIDRTTETGTAFIGKFSLLTLVHTYLACGHPNLGPPLVTGIDYRVNQLPRVQILEPNISMQVENPEIVAVKWRSEWLRWDGMTYTDEFDAAFAQDESQLTYVLMYMRVGEKDPTDRTKEVWRYMADNEKVMPPDGPGLGKHYQSSRQLTDAAAGDEQWDWDMSDAVMFPEDSYVIRVEAYRQGCPLHYAHHMEKIFVSR